MWAASPGKSFSHWCGWLTKHWLLGLGLPTGDACSGLCKRIKVAGISPESQDSSEPEPISACKADRLVEMDNLTDSQLQSKSL